MASWLVRSSPYPSEVVWVRALAEESSWARHLKQGLNLKPSINFSCIKMFFTRYLLYGGPYLQTQQTILKTQQNVLETQHNIFELTATSFPGLFP